MNGLNFADILLIVLVCLVIFAILSLVNRGKKSKVKQKNNDTEFQQRSSE